MAENKKTLRRAAGGADKDKTASAMARRAARTELKRIFDEEVKQRESEGQLSRSRTTSHSHP